jgi:LL-diaminopimelate aminotransferase
MKTFERAERLKVLPPYLFAEMDKKRKAASAQGRDVINLGVGDPDMPTPSFVIERLKKEVHDPKTHQYSLDDGDPAFVAAIGRFFKKRYGVALTPDEIVTTIGSKEAIGHLPLAFVNPGDVCLIPEPGYPPYRSGATFAGADCRNLPLLRKNGFFPDLDGVPEDVARRVKILYLNYPNSPTGVLATKEFFSHAVAFCRKYGCILAQDAAYAELTFDGRALSVLEIDGARDVSIEFHSLSKTFNMTGWRVGFAAGNPDILAGLRKVKANVDSGIFMAIQRAGAAALDHYDDLVPGLITMYRKRRDSFCAGLKKIGYDVTPPAATFYVWMATPGRRPSFEVCERLLSEADIVMIPGAGFGPPGEGFIRATLTAPEERLNEAVARMARIRW